MRVFSLLSSASFLYPVGSRNPRSRPCARGCEITDARNLTNPTADDEELRDLLDQLWPRESTPKVAKIILCPSESRLRLHTLRCIADFIVWKMY